MAIHMAKIEVWNGRTFLLLDFRQAPTEESLGSVIREYVAAMGLRLVYWCKEG
ncbi:MAG: hypothetical protein HC851_22045 [Acaryochloris sp. RU_4_1]|nr:hypothetical protein [Acaryochloris sp. RU_4_1]NJR55667.1 hypothetical protein [Acaryochloris sp. CRU_2_0]